MYCAAFQHDPDVRFTVGQNKNPKQQQTVGYYLTGNHAIHFINCIKHLFASQCMHTFWAEVKVISIKCNLHTHCARAHQKITYPCDLEMEKRWQIHNGTNRFSWTLTPIHSVVKNKADQSLWTSYVPCRVCDHVCLISPGHRLVAWISN